MAPDDRPAGRRCALLIATATYGDPGLAALRAPTGDVAALAGVLGDEAIGGFEVRELIDRPTEALRAEIEEFFGHGRPPDLLLLYVSGHGVLSQSRRFYFATASTNLRLLRSTAIEDGFVNDVMQSSRARSIVLVLDCCHSGAFGKGLVPKSATTVDVEHRFEGQGRVILSASTELEYAFEEADQAIGVSELEPAAPGSLFTRSVVEGLRSGDADLDGDGRISVDDLYDYVCRRVRERAAHQTPGLAGDIRGEITIARSGRRPQLPPELASAVESNLAGIREGAVAELAALVAAGSGGLAATARDALERLAGDDSRRVSAAAAAALGRAEPAPSTTLPPPAERPPAEPPGAPPYEPTRRGRPWPLIGGAIAVVAVLAVVGVLLLGGGGGESPPAPNGAPYVFSAGGSVQVVLGVPQGSEPGSQAVSGVVVVDAMNGGTLLNNKTGGVPQQPRPDDSFGAAVASADFNDDGLADLAVGVPGRGGVSVIYAPPEKPGRFIDSADLAKPPEVGAFGAALVAGDFNGDGTADLAVGAPGTEDEQQSREPGSIDILFGGPRGLSAANAARIPEVHDKEQGFGSRLAAGDVDRDGRLDLVEGAPFVPSVNNGHLSYCEGGQEGPSRCVDVPDASASDLAVGDINGDRFADVVAGDDDYIDGGGVKVWLGSGSPLSGEPAVITQRTDGVPGDLAPGDEFGSDVAIGDVTGDRRPDIVVTAPKDENGTGSVTVIPGSRTGADPAGAQLLVRPSLPGARFGAALSLIDYDNDDLPEVIVGAAKVTNPDEALWAYVSHEGSGVGPQPEPATGLAEKVTLTGDTPLYIGR